MYLPGVLACVCCACRTQYDGMALRCLLSLLHYNVVSLCRSFVTTELVSLARMKKHGHCKGMLFTFNRYFYPSTPTYFSIRGRIYE